MKAWDKVQKIFDVFDVDAKAFLSNFASNDITKMKRNKYGCETIVDAVAEAFNVDKYFILYYEATLDGLKCFPPKDVSHIEQLEDSDKKRELIIARDNFEKNFFEIASGKDILDAMHDIITFKDDLYAYGCTDVYERSFDTVQTIVKGESVVSAERGIISTRLELYGGYPGLLSKKRLLVISCYCMINSTRSLGVISKIEIEDVNMKRTCTVVLDEIHYDYSGLENIFTHRNYRSSEIEGIRKKIKLGEVDSNPFIGFPILPDISKLDEDTMWKNYTNYYEELQESESRKSNDSIGKIKLDLTLYDFALACPGLYKSDLKLTDDQYKEMLKDLKGKYYVEKTEYISYIKNV